MSGEQTRTRSGRRVGSTGRSWNTPSRSTWVRGCVDDVGDGRWVGRLPAGRASPVRAPGRDGGRVGHLRWSRVGGHRCRHRRRRGRAGSSVPAGPGPSARRASGRLRRPGRRRDRGRGARASRGDRLLGPVPARREYLARLVGTHTCADGTLLCTVVFEIANPRSARRSASWRHPKVGCSTAKVNSTSTTCVGVAFGSCGWRRALGINASGPYFLAASCQS